MSTQFGLFGPSDKHCMISGGFCMSVFAITKKEDDSKKTLLVKPREHARWKEEWAPNWRLYSPELLSNEYSSWRFPSSYIREGESPEETLSRVIRDQLGLSNFKVLSSKLLNFYDTSRRYPDRMHWDYCFVYNVKIDETPALRPWYSSVDYVDLTTLDQKDFGSSQGGLLKELGL
jgi:ADP-ribose pyrophosphatase YjhB (NUDIX family)